MSKLLLLEDDESLIDGLRYSLEKNGFVLDVACSLMEARERLKDHHFYDLLLLDVTLPDGSGFQLCEEVRRAGDETPIIFLTAADEETSIIRGLDCGGDDYITKPFKLGELCSRIRAILRRSAGQKKETEGKLISGNLQIDQIKGKVFLGEQILNLTSAEYRLLCLLVSHAGQILTRTVILDVLWDGSGNFVDDNTLSVYIRRLREKVEEDPSEPKRLLTVRGLGYRWEESL